MDKELTGYEFQSPFFKASTIINFKDTDIGKSILPKTLSQNHRNYIETSFESFYEKLLTIISKPEIIELLKNLKGYFKNYVYFSISTRFMTDNTIGLIRDCEDKEELLLKHIMGYIIELFFFAGLTFDVLSGGIDELQKLNKYLEREKALLHNALDIEESEDRRKPNKKCEDYIKEFIDNENYDKTLTKEILAKKIKKWINDKYPGKNFSVNTIRPKLSNML